MKKLNAKTLERVYIYIYIYIDRFNEIKNKKINKEKDSKKKPVIDTG